MTYPQGAIVAADDPFGNNPERPYLIVSNDTVPFPNQECIAVAITTTERDPAIELTPNRLEQGRLPRKSFVSPWTVVPLKHWMISKQPALATKSTVDTVRKRIDSYLQV